MNTDPIKEIDCAGFPKTIKLLVGSHQKIVIEKLYGPTSVRDFTVVWEGNDWNVRHKKARIRAATIAEIREIIEKRDPLKLRDSYQWLLMKLAEMEKK